MKHTTYNVQQIVREGRFYGGDAMKVQKRILFMLMLVFSVILSTVPLACATEAETEHEHNYQCVGYDSQFHTVVCSICGDSRTTTHTYTEICTVCGYAEHEHIWQFSGETYSDQHGMKCTQCDSTTTENCTFGSNGCCTVCGQSPAHWHDFKWNGKQHSERYHLLECDCGETSVEEHRLVWDGVNRTDVTHGVYCVVCGVTRTHGHWYSHTYENGNVCVECGFGSTNHTWKYNDFSDNEGHELICTDCNKTRFETHKPNSNNICSVCGSHVSNSTEKETEPSGSESEEKLPNESKPAETEPPNQKPTENNQNSSGSNNKTDQEYENNPPTAPTGDGNSDHEQNTDDKIDDNTQPPTDVSGSNATETSSEEEITSAVTMPEEPAIQKEETHPVVQDEHDHVHEISTPVINSTALMALLAIVALLTLAGFLTVVLIKLLKK